MTKPQDIESHLRAIEERLKASTPLDENGKCKDCGFDTVGYRHRYGCLADERKEEFQANAPTDLERLLACVRKMSKASKKAADGIDSARNQEEFFEYAEYASQDLQIALAECEAILKGEK